MMNRSSLLLSLASLLLLLEYYAVMVSAFSTTPRSSSSSSSSRHAAVNNNQKKKTALWLSSPNEQEDMDATTTTTSPEQQQQQEERVYYSILSENEPTTNTFSQQQERPPMTAGDVLSNFDSQPLSSTTSTTNYVTLNGWTPKEDYALWGLPGASIAPLSGYFDPIGFCRQGTPLNDAKRLREAEVQHGRVAMMATVGYVAGEWMAHYQGNGGGPFGITGPANDQLQQVPAPAFWLLTALIATAELYRARLGWVEPQLKIGSKTLWTLRDSYYPGDLGFDPLGLKPQDNYDFQVMQSKELSHGRLAMLGWAGMCSQELVNHRTLAETWEFYQLWMSGGNPYDAYYY